MVNNNVTATTTSSTTTTTPKPLSDAEKLRRSRRKGSYHLVASRNKLPSNPEDEEEDMLWRYLTEEETCARHANASFNRKQQMLVNQAKKELLRELGRSHGDTTTPKFQAALEDLVVLYKEATPPTSSRFFDARERPHKPTSKNYDPTKPQMEGMWITLSKPQWSGCLGMKEDETERNFLYTLGRMSFDMFRPTELVCSIQGTFNPVHVVRSKDIPTVPSKLKDEIRDEKKAVVRTYDIVTAFTIEPHNSKYDKKGPENHNNNSSTRSPNHAVDHPIEALMTTYGYVLANPENPHRLTIWFTDGTIEVIHDAKSWRKVFSPTTLPKRTFREQVRVHVGAKVAVGAVPSQGEMEEDGRMSYHLKRPIGGHTTAYIDILYMDGTVRIAKANNGVVYVFGK